MTTHAKKASAASRPGLEYRLRMGQLYWLLDVWDGAALMGSMCFRQEQRRTAEAIVSKLKELGFSQREA